MSTPIHPNAGGANAAPAVSLVGIPRAAERETPAAVDAVLRLHLRPSNRTIPMPGVIAPLLDNALPGVDAAAVREAAALIAPRRAALLDDPEKLDAGLRAAQARKGVRSGACRRAANAARDAAIRAAPSARAAVVLSADFGTPLSERQCHRIRNVRPAAVQSQAERDARAPRRYIRWSPEEYRARRRGFDDFSGEPRPWLFQARTPELRAQLIAEERWSELYARGFDPRLTPDERDLTLTDADVAELARRVRAGASLSTSYRSDPYPAELRTLERRRDAKRLERRRKPRAGKPRLSADLRFISAPPPAPPAPPTPPSEAERAREDSIRARIAARRAELDGAPPAPAPAAPHLLLRPPRKPHSCAVIGCGMPPPYIDGACLQHAANAEKARKKSA